MRSGVRAAPSLPGRQAIVFVAQRLVVEELFGHAEPRKLAPGAAPLPPHIAGPVRPFRRLDLDDDGALELADFDGLSISAHPRVSPGAVIATLDLDGDGALSPDEFAAAFDD